MFSAPPPPSPSFPLQATCRSTLVTLNILSPSVSFIVEYINFRVPGLSFERVLRYRSYFCLIFLFFLFNLLFFFNIYFSSTKFIYLRQPSHGLIYWGVVRFVLLATRFSLSSKSVCSTFSVASHFLSSFYFYSILVSIVRLQFIFTFLHIWLLYIFFISSHYLFALVIFLLRFRSAILSSSFIVFCLFFFGSNFLFAFLSLSDSEVQNNYHLQFNVSDYIST